MSTNACRCHLVRSNIKVFTTGKNNELLNIVKRYLLIYAV